MPQIFVEFYLEHVWFNIFIDKSDSMLLMYTQAHVSATVQILIDSFRVTGIIDYGNAASVSPSLKLADVAVLGKTAFTGAWTWEVLYILKTND